MKIRATIPWVLAVGVGLAANAGAAPHGPSGAVSGPPSTDGGLVGGSLGGGYGGHGGPHHCGPPTLAQCGSATYLRTWCGRTVHDTCMTMLKNEAQRQHDALAKAASAQGGTGLSPAILPRNMKRTGEILDVAIDPYDQSDAANIRLNTDFTYSNVLATARSVGSFGTYEFDRVTPHLDPIHATYGLDNDGKFEIGNGVDEKCAEYVYKKYWDYNRFEDAAASCKHDYRCVADVAVMDTQPGLAMRVLRSKSPLVKQFNFGEGGAYFAPRALPVQLPTLAVSQPKNVFFGLDPRPPAFTGDHDPDANIPHVAYWIERYSNSDTATAIVDDSKGAVRQESADRFDWHVAMHATHTTYAMTIAEYEDIERRTDEIASLWAAARDHEWRLRNAGPDGRLIADRILNPRGFDKCGNRRMTDPSGTGDGAAPLPSPPPKPPGKSCDGDFNPMVYYMSSGSDAAYLLDDLIRLARMLVAEWNHKSVLDGATLDRGCLSLANARCDWTPKSMVREYVAYKPIQDAREHDFHSCVQKTVNHFAAMIPAYDTTDDVTHELVHGLADVYSLEHWFSIADKRRKNKAGKLHWRYDDTPSTPPAGADAGSGQSLTIGDDHPDGGQILGSTATLGAGYSYSTSWRVPYATYSIGGEARFCNTGASFGGSISADVYTFGAKTSLAQASFKVHAGPDTGNVPQVDANASYNKIFGAAIAAYDTLTKSKGATALPDSGFHFVPASDLNASGGTSVVVWVGAVPVTLAYNTELAVGMTYDADGTHQTYGCGDPLAEGALAPWELSGKLEPWASANVGVSGAIGAEFFGLGAEAGIEGNVTLVKIGTPLVTKLSVDDRLSSDGTVGVKFPHLNLSATAQVDIHILEGDIKAFAEICPIKCFRTEKQLWHWQVASMTHDLFKPLDESFDLMSVTGAIRPPSSP